MAGRKERYKKDYEVVEQLSPDGRGKKKELVYHGKYYRLDMGDDELKILKRKYVLLVVASVIFYILMGVLPCHSMGFEGVQASPYVILPFAISVIPLGMMIAKVIMFITRPRSMEFVDYDKYVVNLKNYAMASAVTVGATALGQLVYVAFAAPEGSVLFELLFVASGIVSALAAYVFYRIQSKQNVKTVR